MLIVALVLAVIGLAALVFAVVTANALVAWVCIGASLLGVVLLIVDALQERRRAAGPAGEAAGEELSGLQEGSDDTESADANYEDFYDDEDGADAADTESAAADAVSDEHNAR
ncbi:hypothetical protein [Mycobacterium talmoniae]|uniref:Transmembrane protein n=1 Tax=Mycobacterium talmoniae TaxID=1858794 RepID=A0A1S1NF83_9MYCO|nr:MULTISPECIES: hypothetical protein [Mycobacterium]OHV04328.1 hypothetical protein BKN37_10485 [Mycobacterium talmoniae]TDH48606.1 hypothetical protein E2F47_23200 [Mycobacterium eburneum]